MYSFTLTVKGRPPLHKDIIAAGIEPRPNYIQKMSSRQDSKSNLPFFELREKSTNLRYQIYAKKSLTIATVYIWKFQGARITLNLDDELVLQTSSR
jgi:hypothetical protein